MNEYHKAIVNEAYRTYIRGRNTTEQEIIYKLATAVHSARNYLLKNDIEKAKEILSKNDYM